MRYIPDASQMKEADLYTIQKLNIPSLELMEQAAISCIDVMIEKQLDMSHVCVVCGSGNNGGDGYAIARLLHLKGYHVSIFFVGNDEKRSEDNVKQKKIADYYQIPIKQEFESEEYSVIVDAIFGNGLSRDIEGKYYDVICKLNQMSGFKVAVDSPSGIHDETGDVMGIAFRADMTIAVAFAKRGQMFEKATPYVGKLEVIDIGIYEDAIRGTDKLTYCYEFGDFVKRFPKRSTNGHKGSFGKVLLIVGSKGMSGAAYLCAKAAYTVGAGLVQIYTHEENRVILQEMLPETIISTYHDYDKDQIHELLRWANVVGIGCGLGMGEVAEQIVRETLHTVHVPCVVDADALNLISKDVTILQNKSNLILTPHMKEMARLLSCEVRDLQKDKMKYLRHFVEEYPVTCVLKDARTLVENATENIFFNLTGNSAMAKGGSGDVLTGIIAGILAQKATLYDAACLGVYLHGTSGDYARDKKGLYSVLAGDLIENISPVLKQIQKVK